MEVSTQNIFSVYSKYDPTRTLTLRNLFARDMKRRFDRFAKTVKQKIVDENFFGTIITTHAPYNFPISKTRMKEFMDWIDEQIKLGLLEISEWEQLGTAIDDAWTNKFVTDSYKRGIMRARSELQKAGFSNIPSIDATGGIAVSMMTPIHLQTVGILYIRVFSELKGVTAAMEQQIARILAQGLIDGDGPMLLARKLIATINGTGMGELGITDTLGRFIPAKRRAEMIARTETIRAHHQAMIQEYRNWALAEVYVLAEFLTAGDDRVCGECEELETHNPYTLDEAMGMIPVHPSCRCLCLPYEPGFDTLIKH